MAVVESAESEVVVLVGVPLQSVSLAARGQCPEGDSRHFGGLRGGRGRREVDEDGVLLCLRLGLRLRHCAGLFVVCTRLSMRLFD
jgi:hypothetical protein